MFGFQRMNLLSAALPSLVAALAASACSSSAIGSNHAGAGGQDASETTSPGAGAPTGGTATPAGGGAGSTTTTAELPPTDSCSGTIPASYITTCSACHTQNGSANSRYPDLYQFRGTLTDFTARVRMGSLKGMAAYPPI